MATDTVYWQPIEKSLPILFGEHIGVIMKDDEDEFGTDNHLVKTYHGTVMVPSDQLKWVG